MHNIIVTMAGLGTRFRHAGFSEPKFRIAIGGKTLFEWSLESLGNFLGPNATVVFVSLKTDDAGPFIESRCQGLGITKFRTVEIESLTDGQATTALIGGRTLEDPDSPVLIYNIDTHVDSGHLHPQSMRGDGWIPCFPGKGNAWSFVRTGVDERALEVREKERISSHATIGLYAFSSWHLYTETYERYYERDSNLSRGERYIAPMYNQLIHDGKDVFISSLPFEAVHPIGTPEELEAFARKDSETPLDHGQ